jgi:hypothetical protein
LRWSAREHERVLVDREGHAHPPACQHPLDRVEVEAADARRADQAAEPAERRPVRPHRRDAAAEADLDVHLAALEPGLFEGERGSVLEAHDGDCEILDPLARQLAAGRAERGEVVEAHLALRLALRRRRGERGFQRGGERWGFDGLGRQDDEVRTLAGEQRLHAGADPLRSHCRRGSLQDRLHRGGGCDDVALVDRVDHLAGELGREASRFGKDIGFGRRPDVADFARDLRFRSAARAAHPRRSPRPESSPRASGPDGR